MANKFFQRMIEQMSDAFCRNAGMIDDANFVHSVSPVPEIEQNVDEVVSICAETYRVKAYNGFSYYGHGAKGRPSFVAFVEGTDKRASTYVEILAIACAGLMQFYDEKHGKNNFVKKLLLDNVLHSDIHARSRELHLAFETPRVVFLIRTGMGNDYASLDTILGLFPEKERDFVVAIDERDIVLVREVHENVSPEELEQIACSIVDTISSEAYSYCNVGIGRVAPTLRQLAKSYKEAQIAIEVGKVFETERQIRNYENLGIGRLIYQLPTTLCEMFLDEVFKRESIDILDQETLFTITKFFENNLNVSETSRQLYVHRNTLVYRLDKVQRLTGLDLRIFDHAIVFKVAMMVKKYLVQNPVKL